MRTVFLKKLSELAKKNKDVMLLTGDLGFSVFEDFMEKFPKQFINMGVAEQNMTGVAAGLALEGKIPFIYSIIPFVTMRNFEQIRNDVCYQNANVKIIGVGAGFTYGPYGHTHHGLEDIGILRTLPGITIFSPADILETEFVTKVATDIYGPVYIRLSRAGENIYEKTPDFTFGKGNILREGADLTFFATGSMVGRALAVSNQLKKKNISAGVISFYTLKPFDEELAIEQAKKSKAVFTLEEHSIIGGLGSIVSEILAESGSNYLFKRIGVPDCFTKEIGDTEYMRTANGLSENQIIDTVVYSMNIWKIH